MGGYLSAALVKQTLTEPILFLLISPRNTIILYMLIFQNSLFNRLRRRCHMTKEKFVLLVLKGNDKCTEAKKLLESKDVAFDIIDVREKGWVPHINRDMGIEIFPTLITTQDIYEGYEEIMKNNF